MRETVRSGPREGRDAERRREDQPRGFLKLGVLGISALAFAAGCAGEEDDDGEGEDDD